MIEHGYSNWLVELKDEDDRVHSFNVYASSRTRAILKAYVKARDQGHHTDSWRLNYVNRIV